MPANEEVEFEERSFKYRFKSIKASELSLDRTAQLTKDDAEHTLDARFYFDPSNNDIVIPIGLRISEIDDPTKEIANIEATFTFETLHFNDNNEVNVFLPRRVAASILGICFSTMRGIMVIRGEGTLLETMILPIVDPIKVLPEKELVVFVPLPSGVATPQI
jgi:hypothetical protein